MAKKRLNKNLIVGLTLLAFMMMIVLSVLMLLQLRQRDPQYFVELARGYEAEGEWRTAAVFYKKAWERSHDGGHLVSCGDMLLEQGEVGRALATFRTALLSQPGLIEAHLRRTELLLQLAQLYRKVDDWERVQEAAETFLNTQQEMTPEQAAFAHHAYGMALLGLTKRDPENAAHGEAELRTAVELAPQVVEYALDLAAHHVASDRAKQGERIFTDLIEDHSAPGADSSKVRQAYARYLAAQQRVDEAETHFQASLAFAETDSAALQEARLGYALFLKQKWSRARRDQPEAPPTEKLFDEVRAVLEQCIATDPDDFDPYLQLAVLYNEVARYGEMVEACEARLQRGFSRKGVKGRRNQLNTFLLMIYASGACVAEAEQARQEGDQEQRESWLQRAEQYLTDARGERPSHPYVLSQEGRVKQARGLDREALNALRAADQAYKAYDTVNWNDKLLLARLHLKLREAGAAKAVLDGVLEEARRQHGLGARFWSLYAQALFYNDELDRALAIADQVLGAAPDHPDMRRLTAAIYERQGRGEEAGRIIEALTGDPAVHSMLKAQRLVLEGAVEQAIGVLRQALAQKKGDPRLVSVLVRVLLYHERVDEARAVVEEALREKPDDLRLLRLSVLVRDDFSPEERDQAVLQIIEAQEDKDQRLRDLIEFHWHKNDLAKTLQFIDEALGRLVAKDTAIARSAPIEQHRALLVAKLSVAATLDDSGSMAAARDAAAEFNVDGAGGKSILGLYHMHRKEYEPAIKAFRDATEAQPTDVRSMTRLGQCLQTVGQSGDARAWYERALRVNPNEGEAHRSLAALAKQEGDTKTYEEHFAACKRLIPMNRWVRAESLARQEEADPHAAIARRETLLAEEPDGADNLRRLAALYEKVEDLDNADRSLARLLALRPDDKDLAVAVSRYYRRTARPERSLEVAKRYADSRRSAEERANARILIASHHLALDELDLVESVLLSAADIAETFEVTQSLAQFYVRRLGRPGKALPWFDKCVEQARARGSGQLPRVLASRVSCLLHRKLNDTKTAQRYAEELRAAFPGYAPGILVESEVHARKGRIQDAIDSLSNYLVQEPHDAYALYQRALHYRAQGRLASAIEDLKDIKRINSLALDLRPRFLLARLYEQSGRTDLRIRELESLAEDAPDSAALEDLVRAYLGAQRVEDAERLVAARINRLSAAPDARWFFLRGRIARELGNPHKALADFQLGARTSGYTAESLIKVLDLFSELNRPAEGIAYYERHAPRDHGTPAPASRYARLLAEADRKPEAVDEFRRAMALAVVVSPAARAAVTADLFAAFAPEAPDFESVKEAISLFGGYPPDGAMARVNERILVRLFRSAKQYDIAGARLERLIATCREDNERVDLLFELGALRQATGDAQRARRAYEEGLKYDGDNWIALNNLAYLLSDELGENRVARPYAERAVAIADNPATLDTLGWIYVGLGEFPLAVAELSRAVRLAPGDPLMYYHLGEAHRRQGQFAAAERVLASGRDLARAKGDSELATLCDESLERVARSDRER